MVDQLDQSRLLASDSEHGFVFMDLYSSILFIASIWFVGRLFSFMYLPDLVGQIFIGVVLGPHVLDFIPEISCWKMIGEVGLMLLIVEAGMEIDLEMLRVIGKRGVTVALLGSLIPLGLGIIFGLYIFDLDINASFAVGASVAPTSMGIALNVLKIGNLLNTPVGQLVIAAAILDDIIALILISELEVLSKQDNTWFDFFKPILVSFALLLAFGLLAIYVVPVIFHKLILPHTKRKYHQFVSLSLVFILVLALCPLAYFAGSSYLLGSFIAGMCFCTEHVVHGYWISQTKRIGQWLLRIFFASTIAFEIPVKKFGNLTVIRNALIISLCVFGKIGTGFWAPGQRCWFKFLVVGFSMAAWGEFAFIVIVYAKDIKLVNDDIMASVILAIVISIVISPSLLRWTIKHFHGSVYREIEQAKSHTGAGAKGHPPLYYFVQCTSGGGWGQTDRMLRALSQKLHIIDMRSFHPPCNNLDAKILYELYLKDRELTLPVSCYRHPSVEQSVHIEERLHQLHKDIFDALNDPKARIRVGRWFAGIEEDVYDENVATHTYELAQKHLEELSEEYDIAVHRMEGTVYNLDGFVNSHLDDVVWERNVTSEFDVKSKDAESGGTITHSRSRNIIDANQLSYKKKRKKSKHSRGLLQIFHIPGSHDYNKKKEQKDSSKTAVTPVLEQQGNMLTSTSTETTASSSSQQQQTSNEAQAEVSDDNVKINIT